jgi:hypothetical protein
MLPIPILKSAFRRSQIDKRSRILVGMVDDRHAAERLGAKLDPDFVVRHEAVGPERDDHGNSRIGHPGRVAFVQENRNHLIRRRQPRVVVRD